MESINDFNKKWLWPPYYVTCDCGEIISIDSDHNSWTCKKCHRIFKLNYGKISLVQDQFKSQFSNTPYRKRVDFANKDHLRN